MDFSEQFPIVFQALNVGFLQTLKLFFVTLLGAIPLGLIISFGSMSRFAPLKYLTKIIVWIIRGTPLMIHTTILVKILRGLNRDIDPKEMISPRGIAPSRVTKNSLRVCKNPVFNACTTIGNCSENSMI